MIPDLPSEGEETEGREEEVSFQIEGPVRDRARTG